MKAILFDGKNIVADFMLGTPKDTVEHLLIMINALIEPLSEKAKEDKKKIEGIGFSIAGVVDFNDRKIMRAPNIEILDGVKLGQMIEERFGYKSIVDNDGKCFIRAEAMLGEGKKYSNIYGIALGTSVGSAWWLDGDVYRGYRNGAGEIAHTIINSSEGLSLEKVYMKLTQGSPASLAEQAYRGDSFSVKSFEELGHVLGVAFANVVNTLDPEVFIVGGGVMGSSDLFLPSAKKAMAEYINNPEARKIKILKSKLGANAGAIGAALLAEQI